MIAAILALLKANPLLAGGAGVAVMGWVMVQARNLPVRLGRFVLDQCTTSMTVYSENNIFQHLDLWLARHPSARKTRRLGIASWRDSSMSDDDYTLTPGSGLHLFRNGMRHYLVNRMIENDKANTNDFSGRRRQTIVLTTLGRSQAPLVALLNQVKRVQDDKQTIPVYIWQSHQFELIERRLKRPMDTVYAAGDLKQTLIDDVEKFAERRGWYGERGIPYRRGYLLEGPPGTGKTTLIFAISCHFNRPVFIINPAAIDNDNTLLRAINSAGANIVVIEDIDSLLVTEERETREVVQSAGTGAAGTSGVTLSGLLNALDGIGARDGRILFITSNRAEVLDSALVRPGRVDKRLFMGNAGPAEAEAMFRRFFPDRSPDIFLRDIESALPLSPADLQNRLLGLAEAAA